MDRTRTPVRLADGNGTVGHVNGNGNGKLAAPGLTVVLRGPTHGSMVSTNGKGNPVLGVDGDDTLFDLKTPALRVLARRFPHIEELQRATHEDVKSFGIQTNFPVTTPDVKAAFGVVWADPIRMGINLTDPEAPERLTRMRDNGITIVITSATDAEHEIFRGVLAHYDIPYDGMYHVPTSLSKLDLPGVNGYVDDFHDMAQPAVEKGRAFIVFGRAWNEEHYKHERVRRAPTWGEVEQHAYDLLR